MTELEMMSGALQEEQEYNDAREFLLSIAGMFSSDEQQAMVWTDEQIDAEMLNRWQGTTGTTAIDSPSYRVAVEVATKIRNDLAAQLIAAQQRIAELESSRGVEPDWGRAPIWARFWAVDADGSAYWYEAEPNAKGSMGYWGKSSGQCEIDPVRRSFSWLNTLRCRQVQEGAE